MQWFRNLKITHKIIGLIIVMIIFEAGSNAVSYFQSQKANKMMNSIYKVTTLSNHLSEIYELTINSSSSIKDLILHGLKNEISDEEEHIKAINEANSKIDELILKNSSGDIDNVEAESLNKFKSDFDDFKLVIDKVVEYVQNNEPSNGYRYWQDNEEQLATIQNDLLNLISNIDKKSEKIEKQNQADANFANYLVLAILLFVIIMSNNMGMFIARIISDPLNIILKNLEELSKGNLRVDDIEIKSQDEIGKVGIALNTMVHNLRNLVQQVAHGVSEVTSSVQEINTAAEETSKGAEQVAINISQLASGSQEQASLVNSSMENIKSINRKVNRISDSSNDSVKISKSAEENANQGLSQSGQAVNKINEIKVSSIETSKTINDLGQLGAEIEVIVELIKNIASQTNLLALNAAIEAARAGEHGKGFAVVAEEVKKLAGESADATDKITNMIKEIQNKTDIAVKSINESVEEIEEGVIIIESVGQSLEEIFTGSKETSTQIESISGEVGRLSLNADEIAKMMETMVVSTEEVATKTEEISGVSQQQTASMQQINANAHDLSQIADNLHRQISAFKV